MENSPSGLWRTLGKRVGVTASRVRISYSPPSGFSGQSESPFFMPGNGFLSTIPTSLAHMPFCRLMPSNDVGCADIDDTLGDTHDGPNRCVTLASKGAPACFPVCFPTLIRMRALSRSQTAVRCEKSPIRTCARLAHSEPTTLSADVALRPLKAWHTLFPCAQPGDRAVFSRLWPKGGTLHRDPPLSHNSKMAIFQRFAILKSKWSTSDPAPTGK